MIPVIYFTDQSTCNGVFQDVLVNLDFSKFQSLKPHLLEEVDKMLANDIAKLMAMIPLQDMHNRKMNNGDAEQQQQQQAVVKGIYFLVFLCYK